MKKTTNLLAQLFVIVVLVAGGLLVSCKKKRADEPAKQNPTTEKPSDRPSSYPPAGHYIWKFNIDQVEQKSHLVIYSSLDSIGYAMQGGMYTNNYSMHKTSYSDKDGENRWIGVGKGGEGFIKDGKYFVLFFKNVEKDKFTVFKKEFATQKEAEDFPLPPASSTDSHGWNEYEKG